MLIGDDWACIGSHRLFRFLYNNVWMKQMLPYLQIENGTQKSGLFF